MSANPLENTIGRILEQTEKRVVTALDEALAESHGRLESVRPDLEAEYDKIVADGRKEADKIDRQVVGSSDLEARNRQLLVVGEAVDRVFDQAVARIADIPRDDAYSNMIESLLREAMDVLRSTEVVVHTSKSDREVVQGVLEQFPDSEIDPEDIECLGGIRIKSRDGTMTFDNTLDARISRLKPLIRKEVAAKFGVKS